MATARLLALNSTGSVTSANTVDAANRLMPSVVSGSQAMMRPRKNSGVDRLEQMFTAGTMVVRSISGA